MKKKFLKIILIIITILLIVYLAISFRKFYIIHKIQNKNNEYKNSNNYYFASTFKSDNHKQEYYFKDDHFKSLDDGILTVYGDNEKQYYVDKNNEIIDISESDFYRRYPSIDTMFEVYEFDKIRNQILFSLSLKNWISVVEHNNQKCYKISDSVQNVYFDKDNLTPIEIEVIKPVDNGAEFDKILEVKLDVVTDEDMKIEAKN